MKEERGGEESSCSSLEEEEDIKEEEEEEKYEPDLDLESDFPQGKNSITSALALSTTGIICHSKTYSTLTSVFDLILYFKSCIVPVNFFCT